jgi:hypothetical protein
MADKRQAYVSAAPETYLVGDIMFEVASDANAMLRLANAIDQFDKSL